MQENIPSSEEFDPANVENFSVEHIRKSGARIIAWLSRIGKGEEPLDDTEMAIAEIETIDARAVSRDELELVRSRLSRAIHQLRRGAIPDNVLVNSELCTLAESRIGQDALATWARSPEVDEVFRFYDEADFSLLPEPVVAETIDSICILERRLPGIIANILR